MIKLKRRYSAVLMSVSSLPSPYGIGGFGEEFKNFIDFLSTCGFSAMQVLPFNLPDYGNSPYGSCSAFAGNYLYIDPAYLKKRGFLSEDELKNCIYEGSPYTVNYDFVYKTKRTMLETAFNNSFNKVSAEVECFTALNPWVADYALFMAIKENQNSEPWQNWPEDLKVYKKAFQSLELFKEKFDFFCFEQYLFSQQYSIIKDYAESKGVAIIGDIPIYVSVDSVDVWKNPELFCLDEDYIPKIVAGVPPDDFSEDGQLWGNPVYNWPQHREDNYAWWISRLERNLQLYDAIRIDHFRGFASYYTIDATFKDAKNGEWKKGPGMELFSKIIEKFGRERIVAEDLGTYSEDVAELLESTGIKGMRVIQFGFSGGNSTHLPHNYPENCFAYIGTHDNNTLLGWLWDLNDEQRKTVLEYCGFVDGDWGKGGYYSKSCRSIIETVFKTSAAVVVIPFQDLCGFGNDARMNIPGIPMDNWRFRTTFETIEGIDAAYFKKINNLFFR